MEEKNSNQLDFLKKGLLFQKSEKKEVEKTDIVKLICYFVRILEYDEAYSKLLLELGIKKSSINNNNNNNNN